MVEIYLYKTLVLVGVLSGLPLIVAAASGLVLSILQSATQIQEQATVYLCKLAAITVLLFVCQHWMSEELLGFFTETLGSLAVVGR